MLEIQIIMTVVCLFCFIAIFFINQLLAETRDPKRNKNDCKSTSVLLPQKKISVCLHLALFIDDAYLQLL